MIVGLLAVVIPARAWAGDGPGPDGAGGVGGPPGTLSVSAGPFFISAGLAAVSLAVLWWRDVIRPGSFARRPARRVEGVPWFVWLVAGLVVFMAAQLGAAMAMAALGGVGGGGTAGVAGVGGVEAVRRSAITHGASYVAALAAAGFMVHALRGAAEGLEIRARAVPWGLLAFALAYPIIHTVTGVSVLIATRIRGAPLSPVAHESLKQIIEQRDSVWAWGMAAGAVLGAPIVEEIMYRVFLQTALLRLWGRAWPAIVTTSVLFAAVHIGVAEPHALPVLLVLGLAMGVAYERTRSPVVPIVMHAVFNLLNVILALWLR